jgi:hypothetical protein
MVLVMVTAAMSSSTTSSMMRSSVSNKRGATANDLSGSAVHSSGRSSAHRDYSFFTSLIILDKARSDDTKNNDLVRELTTSTPDVITTIAGTGSTTYSGDNGQATSAGIGYPHGVALDSSGKPRHSMLSELSNAYVIPLGNVYIANSGNYRVRKLTIFTGIITTIAGTGSGSYNGDNIQATSATLNYPTGVTVDSSGNILTNFYLLSFLLILFTR